MMAGEALLAVTMMIGVAAASPGPNNLIVMTAAGRGGFAAAVPAIAGVVAGSLVLLVLVWAGAGKAFAALPPLRDLLRILGALYLVWLGLALVLSALRQSEARPMAAPQALPGSLAGVALFQLVNPKSWVLVATAVAAVAAPMKDGEVLAALGFILVAVTLPCLSLWALAGAVILGRLESRRPRQCFDAVLGVLLVGSALLLVLR
ncbi:LysE family translocator [Pelagibius marinus]|uniref:LysE family translocator n=1 Tax=Pelagibius marinus TaxID=2762760 RepID=UPI0018727E6C|nr:LysE family transporter [Pelagibius marinus]